MSLFGPQPLRRHQFGRLLLSLLALGLMTWAAVVFASRLDAGAGTFGELRHGRRWLLLVGAALQVVLLGGLLLAFGCVFRATVALFRRPHDLRLARYGPPEWVARAIEAELPGAITIDLGLAFVGFVRSGWAQITPHWLVVLQTGSVAADASVRGAIHLPDLVRATRRPAPSGRAPRPVTLAFLDRHGAEVEVTGKEEAVLRVLAEVLARAPGVLATSQAGASARGDGPGADRPEGIQPGEAP
jgi:hypothetical protein